jgi:hypothetical protein
MNESETNMMHRSHVTDDCIDKLANYSGNVPFPSCNYLSQPEMNHDD